MCKQNFISWPSEEEIYTWSGAGEETEWGEDLLVAELGGNRGDLFTWICQLVRWIRGLFALERPTSAWVPGEKYTRSCTLVKSCSINSNCHLFSTDSVPHKYTSFVGSG